MNTDRVYKALDILDVWYCVATRRYNFSFPQEQFYGDYIKFKTVGLIQHDRYLNEYNFRVVRRAEMDRTLELIRRTD